MSTPPSFGSAPEPTGANRRTFVTYQPILDVALGSAAGFQTQAQWDSPLDAPVRGMTVHDADVDGRLTAATVRTALDAFPTLPTNTFVTVPVGFDVLASRPLRAVLDRDLRGVVLDIRGYHTAPNADVDAAIQSYRQAGVLISVGGNGAQQPELTSIVRLKPAFVRLGRDWVRDVDRSDAKRSAIELIGQLAGQLDAWILAEGVASAAELRALSELHVPLAQGPFVGAPQRVWPQIDASARTALPAIRPDGDGTLRRLLQQAYTARDGVAAARVLPETTGFDVVVVIDERQRPTSMLEPDRAGFWGTSEVLTVNIDTPMPDAVSRAMARPRHDRFTPLVCTDNAGRFVGILRIEKLVSHLADGVSA